MSGSRAGRGAGRGADRPSWAPGEVHRMEFVWLERRDGFVMRASSFADPNAQARWHTWLAGQQNLNQAPGIRLPSSSRCFLTDGRHAAIINRECTRDGSDSRRDIRVSVLVGTVDTLRPRFALELDPWPETIGAPNQQAVDPPDGVWPVAVPLPPEPLSDPAPSHAALGNGIDPCSAEIAGISPVPGVGEVRLIEPLATLTTGALEQLRRRAAGERHYQLAAVGPDEPQARRLCLALVALLAPVERYDGGPTFSTFESEFPRANADVRDPHLLCMPRFHTPLIGYTRPTAYVFLAPALRPTAGTALEFAPRGAAGNDVIHQAARILVAAYCTGGAELVADAPTVRADQLHTRAERWLDQLRRWATTNRLPDRPTISYPPSVATTTPHPGALVPWNGVEASRGAYALGSAQAIGATGPGYPSGPADRDDPGYPLETIRGESDASGPGGQASAPLALPPDRITPAEAVVRDAIHAFDERQVTAHTHTADALVDALIRRQWLSSDEADDLARFLREFLPGLAGATGGSGRAPRAGARNQRAHENRPDNVTDLVAFAIRWPGGAGRDDIIGRLTFVLTPRYVRTDAGRLEQALLQLTVPPTDQRRPDIEQATPTTQQEVGWPSTLSPAETVDKIGLNAFKEIELATRLVDERAGAPAILAVLVDLPLRSLWLSDSDLHLANLAGLRGYLFERLGQRPRQLPPQPGSMALDTATARQVKNTGSVIISDIFREIASQFQTPADIDNRNTAEHLLAAIDSISANAVGGDPNMVGDRAAAVSELRERVELYFEPHIDPAEKARRAVHDRFWSLVHLVTADADGLDVAEAVYQLAAILPATGWVRPVEVPADDYFRTMSEVVVAACASVAPGAPAAPPQVPGWAYDDLRADLDLDLEKITAEMAAHMRAALIELSTADGSVPSLRDVAHKLSTRLGEVAVELGEFGVERNRQLDSLFAAVEELVRAAEKDAEYRLRGQLVRTVEDTEHRLRELARAAEDTERRLRGERDEARSSAAALRHQLDERTGHEGNAVARLQKQLETQVEDWRRLNGEIVSLAGQIEGTPAGGELAAPVTALFRGTLSQVPGLEADRVVAALDRYRQRTPPPEPPHTTEREPQDARKVFEEKTRQIEAAAKAGRVRGTRLVRLIADWGEFPYSQRTSAGHEADAFEEAAAALVRRSGLRYPGTSVFGGVRRLASDATGVLAAVGIVVAALVLALLALLV